MTNEKILFLLKKLDACPEAINWIRQDKLTLKQAWDTCERADWLIWFAAETKMVSHQTLVLTACDCAETVLKYIPKGEDRPKEAIKAARKWALNPTEENKTATRVAAHIAARAADAALTAAHEAAYAAHVAHKAAHDAAYAAVYAADAADAASDITFFSAARKQLCGIVRDRIKLKKGE